MRSEEPYLGFLHVHMHFVAEVGGWKAGCCSLVAVEHQPQAVRKDMQAMTCVPGARSAPQAAFVQQFADSQ